MFVIYLFLTVTSVFVDFLMHAAVRGVKSINIGSPIYPERPIFRGNKGTQYDLIKGKEWLENVMVVDLFETDWFVQTWC